jgi:hypothetical protein
MPERTRRLQATLAELHQELAEAGTLDAESRALLQAMAQEIRASLDGATGALQPPPADSVVDRLRTTALRLEVEHPRVAAVIGRLLDTLASVGI